MLSCTTRRRRSHASAGIIDAVLINADGLLDNRRAQCWGDPATHLHGLRAVPPLERRRLRRRCALEYSDFNL